MLVPKKLTKCFSTYLLHPFLCHTQLVKRVFLIKEIISEIVYSADRAPGRQDEFPKSEVPEKNTNDSYQMANPSQRVSFILTSEHCGLRSGISVKADMGEEELRASK